MIYPVDSAIQRLNNRGQVFIDPTFFGIFVCGPLQSFVVNVGSFLPDLLCRDTNARRHLKGGLKQN